ncbi:MAG: thioredoxin domain-containing protein [Candidatus Anstonellales archaeon]
MDNETKTIAALAIIILLLAWALFQLNKPPSQPLDPTKPFPQLTVSTGQNKLFGIGQVKIVEITDYLCPFCRRFAIETEPKIKEKYSSKAEYFVRYFPVHGEPSSIAANGAMCAGDQGAFYQMHTLLFERAPQLSSDTSPIKEIGEEIGLDSQALSHCIDSKKYYSQISADAKAAQEYGVTGTPTIIVIISKDMLSKEEAAKRAADLNLKLYEDASSYTFAVIGYRDIQTFDRLLEGI